MNGEVRHRDSGGQPTFGERANGMFFTPLDVAMRLITGFFDEYTLDVHRVLDLAAGAGSLLLAADRVLPGPLTLVGVEQDAMVAECCRNDLADRMHASSDLAIFQGDGLDPEINTRLSHQFDRFDLVVGNPPFLSPRLRSLRYEGSNGVEWSKLRHSYPDITRATTDLSAYFVARAFGHLRVGGVCAMIVPISFLSSDGASQVRRVIEGQGEVLKVDRLPDDAFAASVATVCLWVRRSSEQTTRPNSDGMSWGSWIAESPRLELPPSLRVKDLARVTAGFRDEFYQVAAQVEEADNPPVALADQGWHRVLTVGHLGWREPLWGHRPVRIGGRALLHPVVSSAALSSMKSAMRALLIPKLVIAPQKRVVAPWIDYEGSVVPLTPVISVLAADSSGLSLSLLAAALASPVAAAFLEHRCAGTALSAKALKFSARDVGEVPLPLNREAWERAGHLWPAWRAGRLWPYLDAIRDAYSVETSVWSELLDWWLPRIGQVVE
ncbi:HsdM family class I SAM-dependent methyltransferase [Ferrimicrobium acidiphilum]|uniref:HsdM family class I SAM-dependent methyltransferase n=1 Tax=Ferrimicrobium acidiphilum TaxID=121039 RepID=UPI0023F39F62|nr:N-6 DNA methylase [Ferrimicrobium acidiphilum]